MSARRARAAAAAHALAMIGPPHHARRRYLWFGRRRRLEPPQERNPLLTERQQALRDGRTDDARAIERKLLALDPEWFGWMRLWSA